MTDSKVKTTITQVVDDEDIFGEFKVEKKNEYGYLGGERKWLGNPEAEPLEEYVLTDGPPEKNGFHANDNIYQPVKFH